MSFVASAIVAVGAGVSAYGTYQNAKAVGEANAKAAKNEQGLYLRQTDNLNQLVKDKEKKLYNIGNIFDRFESTGAFGDTETLKNLRKAQSDFSALAAGDFSGFESQLKKSMSDSLVGVVDSGSPIGTYAGLAADTQMGYRKDGIQTSVGISEFLSNESQKLLGQEFGIMDQKFNTGYQLDSNWVNKTNGYRLGEAATAGVATQAIGGAIQSIGSAIGSYGTGGVGGANSGATNAAIAAAPQALTVIEGAQRANIANTSTPYPMIGNINSYSSYSTQARTLRRPQYSGSSGLFNQEPIPPVGGYDQIPMPDAGLDGAIGPWRSGYGMPSSEYDPVSQGVLPSRQTSASIMSGVGAKISYS